MAKWYFGGRQDDVADAVRYLLLNIDFGLPTEIHLRPKRIGPSTSLRIRVGSAAAPAY